MKLSDKIAAYQGPHPFYSFELFPPRTDQGFENLIGRISRLSTLGPLAISITWGAGGFTSEQSLDLASLTQSKYGVDTVLHLTCTNMEQGTLTNALKIAQERGIQNILALRGDAPRGQESWITVDQRFKRAIDLVSFIRSSPEFSSTFCIGVAGYPDGHVEGLHDEDAEIEFLKAKVDAGADFIVTQIFYDVDRFSVWLKKVREKGITIPVIPGIMPIQSIASFQRVVQLCGIKVPKDVTDAISLIRHNDQLVKDYGVSLAVEMIKRLTREKTVPGVHFCTLNLEKSVQRILEVLHWTVMVIPMSNKLIVSTKSGISPKFNAEDPHSVRVTTPITATNSAARKLATMPPLDGEAGLGELYCASGWDEFPNGRFGDFQSPAFGNQDLWGGPGIRGYLASQWGSPKSLKDLTQLFLDHLHSKIPATPFSPFPLSAESLSILKYLERMTKRGWWTVGSQPAADCVSSGDKVLGWGPTEGYVFQKGFVEFFCEGRDVDVIEHRIDHKGEGWVHWFAGNYKGQCRSNVPQGGRNTVTWGVFPGQEIVQSTIIEEESFLLWKNEAFSIWTDWATFYAPGSKERALIESVKDEWWLVSVIHNDYKNAGALWAFLFDEVEVYSDSVRT